MRTRRTIIFALVMMISVAAMSQQANTLYYMNRVFQSQTVNVSAIPENKIQIGGLIVPVFGQLPPPLYFNYGNNSFNYNHILHYGAGDMKDSLVIDLPLLMKKAKNTIAIRNELRWDYLNFSLKTKSNATFSVSIADRLMFGTTIPRDMLDFVINGNAPYMYEGKMHDFSKLSFSANGFHEVGLGFATTFASKFSVGARLKLLFGMFDVSSKVSRLSVTTDPETFFITADADFQLRKSMPFVEITDTGINKDFSSKSFLKMLSTFGNPGVAVDLGLTYNITDNMSVSVSATDIGFINWMQDAQVASANGETTIEGLEIGLSKDENGKLQYSLVNMPQKDSIGQYILDTVVELFDMNIKDKKYIGWLPSNVYVDFSYKFHEKFSLGLLYRGEFYRKSYIQAVTLSANSNINHWLSLHASWSLIDNTVANLGFGFSARLGFITWYMVTDNVLAFVFPQKAKTLNLHMGCNLTFGHAKKKSRTAAKL